MSAVTIPEAARTLRAAIETYDQGHPARRKDGTLQPGARAELVAVDPVLEAAVELLDLLADHGYGERTPA